MESLNRVTISRSALAHNFALCRQQAGEAAVMAMVKADGYGHGMVECARLFAACGAAAFGVAEAVEVLLHRGVLFCRVEGKKQGEEGAANTTPDQSSAASTS